MTRTDHTADEIGSGQGGPYGGPAWASFSGVTTVGVHPALDEVIDDLDVVTPKPPSPSKTPAADSDDLAQAHGR